MSEINLASRVRGSATIRLDSGQNLPPTPFLDPRRRVVREAVETAVRRDVGVTSTTVRLLRGSESEI